MPIRESADPELQRSLELKAGPAQSRLSLEGVPLERQISVKFPTIITPSAEAEQIRIDIPGVSAQEAAQHYVGELRVWGPGFASSHVVLNRGAVCSDALLCAALVPRSCAAPDRWLRFVRQCRLSLYTVLSLECHKSIRAAVPGTAVLSCTTKEGCRSNFMANIVAGSAAGKAASVEHNPGTTHTASLQPGWLV